MYYVIPDYLAEDVLKLLDIVNKLKFDTEYLVPDLKEIFVYWDGEEDEPSGKLVWNPDDRRYNFLVTEKTMRSLNEGHGVKNG